MCDDVKESLQSSITEVPTKIDRLLSYNNDLAINENKFCFRAN